ncbi:dTDP-4-dehydrorhamnose reductase [Raoultella ornithinolytica]|uniref:dTDP-4-dehydrorhamnose reductase n=1 Tax=Raoultella ornithinolytica TaxID=54291 RepID=UPI001EF89189|nr:dTDP-4-dehydrorhamnose reductase [Raoultella ornithinolytica]ULI44110.1 dTDP-4-dehydrorhamnose reductase [Raoultella ornithinolytica]HDT3906318.1 dTDP-4-dehydrorhamnose reductase [Raoultella ornithinolytica]HDX8322166.1 dTDP-4-dehydrorhamnose reductase [Raoultella ornithinolytica]HDX8333838.1 dTDP-4-dehydrorhamnose reductase [Raoultella ornithinolytica]
MKLLLTGANGQLGRCIQDRLPAGWSIWATDSNELDITNQDAVLSAVKEFQPDAIINAAAYTAVDKAEGEPDLARLVNEVGPENLAIASKINGSLLIHVSTDYVFDGTSSTPYCENDKTGPLGIYGITKLAGEKAVIRENPKSIIIRTAWVFSEYGNNFVKTMLRVGKDRSNLNIVDDQVGCPTYAGDIANTIINLLKIDAPVGIYNYCGDSFISWCGFSKVIFDIAKELNIVDTTPIVNAITSDQYPTPVKRPNFSVLNTSKIEQLGMVPSNWKNALYIVLPKIS